MFCQMCDSTNPQNSLHAGSAMVSSMTGGSRSARRCCELEMTLRARVETGSSAALWPVAEPPEECEQARIESAISRIALTNSLMPAVGEKWIA